MKKRPNNPVFSEEVAKSLIFRCMVCQKACEGFYGQHASESRTPQGTCSGACERIQMAKPRYPGYTEEEFLARQGETFDENDDILTQGE